MLPAVQQTPPAPVRSSSPPRVKKPIRTLKRTSTMAPRRLVNAQVAMDSVGNVSLGMVITKRRLQNEECLLVTSTHTVLMRSDLVVLEIHPPMPEFVGQKISITSCF